MNNSSIPTLSVADVDTNCKSYLLHQKLGQCGSMLAKLAGYWSQVCCHVSHVSIKIKTEQFLTSHCADLSHIVHFIVQRSFSIAGLCGLAASLAQMPARLPRFLSHHF